MKFSRYSDKGRTIMVRFECQRCKQTVDEPLETVLARSPDTYDHLHNYKQPAGWSDNFYGWLLCPDCTKQLHEFMQKGGTKE